MKTIESNLSPPCFQYYYQYYVTLYKLSFKRKETFMQTNFSWLFSHHVNAPWEHIEHSDLHHMKNICISVFVLCLNSRETFTERGTMNDRSRRSPCGKQVHFIWTHYWDFFFICYEENTTLRLKKKKGINLLRQITVQCSTAIIIVYLCNYASKAAHTVITENELCKWESGDVRGGFTKADWGVFKDVKENTHNTHFVWRWIILSRFSVCATALSSSREINKSGFLFAFRAIASGEKLLQRANTITGEQNMPLKSEYH